uniref:Uncharacterized protein n=1 Tax=Oryza sativa subsp. japonica TaxID=39947 RepID=Q6Z6D4_ORYSJ|nr:hypothetical protein [Oryza sativa Japonica Group]BAD38432.1 hypothetical protein [Oryza sativa Japonica Group]
MDGRVTTDRSIDVVACMVDTRGIHTRVCMRRARPAGVRNSGGPGARERARAVPTPTPRASMRRRMQLSRASRRARMESAVAARDEAGMGRKPEHRAPLRRPRKPPCRC